MLRSVFGTPSDLTHAGLRLVQALMGATVGPYQWIGAGTAEDLATAWAKRQHDHALLFADIPDVRITALVRETHAPTIVFLEDPAAVVVSLARRRNITGLAALRLTSQSYATLHDLAMEDSALLLTQEDARAPIRDIVAAISDHCRIGVASDALGKVLSGLGPAPDTAPLCLSDIPASSSGASPGNEKTLASDVALASRALQGYHPLQRRQAARRFHWPKETFLRSEPQGAPLEGVISLIGGARCFIYGPYFHLPPGRWTARAQFSVTQNISGNGLKLDIYTDDVIFEGDCVLPESGSFQLEVEFEVREPRLPVQLRFFNQRGAIEGEFDLHGVTVERADIVDPS